MHAHLLVVGERGVELVGVQPLARFLVLQPDCLALLDSCPRRALGDLLMRARQVNGTQ